MPIMINSDNIFLVLFFGSVVLAFTTVVLWHILHLVLCKKYDKILFREPYFRLTELTVYRSWPLSLFRSMGYILLLGIPTLAKKRRFKGVSIDTTNETFLIITCKIFLTLGSLSILFVLFLIIWGLSL